MGLICEDILYNFVHVEHGAVFIADAFGGSSVGGVELVEAEDSDVAEPLEFLEAVAAVDGELFVLDVDFDSHGNN